jgi:hypothetical protein
MITIAKFKNDGYHRLEMTLPSDDDFYGFTNITPFSYGEITLDGVTSKILIIDLNYFLNCHFYKGDDLGLELSIILNGKIPKFNFKECDSDYKNHMNELNQCLTKNNIEGVKQFLRALKRKIYNTHEVKTEYVNNSLWGDESEYFKGNNGGYK